MIKDRDITFQVIDGTPQVPVPRAEAPCLISQWHKNAGGRLVMRWIVELEMDEQRILDASAA
jgi:hypothetical protein